MAYASLISNESIKSDFLVVMSPRRRVGASSWSVYSGSVYQASFTYGYVTTVEVDGVALTSAGSVSLSSGQYYYDHAAQTLYVYLSSGLPTSTSKYVVATYEIHVATKPFHWYRIPDDDTSTVVYFEGYVATAPSIKKSTSDVIYGLLPSQSTQMELYNADHWLEQHLHDGSFHGDTVEVYHLLDDGSGPAVANVKYVGILSCRSLRLTAERASFSLTDEVSIFNKQFSNGDYPTYYSTSDFGSQLDPNYIGKPVRRFYGLCLGFVPVNIEYADQSPTVNDNRFFIVGNIRPPVDGGTTCNKTISIPLNGAKTAYNTTTKTHVTSIPSFLTNGLTPDAVYRPQIYFDRAAVSDEYRTLTGVGVDPTHGLYIEHTALASPITNGSDLMKINWITNLFIKQGDTTYEAFWPRDFTVDTATYSAQGCAAIVLSTSLESNISLPSTLSPSDQVTINLYADHFGNLSGNDLESTYTNIVGTIVDVIKHAGVTSSECNYTSFSDINSDSSANMGYIGIAIPKGAADEMPTYKSILEELCFNGMLKFYRNSDQLWELSLLQPIPATAYTMTGGDIVQGSLLFNYDYGDLAADIFAHYSISETEYLVIESNVSTYRSFLVASQTATPEAEYINKASGAKTVETLFYDSDDAARFARRLSYIYGERNGKIEFSTSTQLYNAELSDAITMSREALPGYSYAAGTSNTREMAVTEISKNAGKVTVACDDQKGIEDNSASW